MSSAALVLNGKLFRGKFEGDYLLCADGGYDMVLAKGVQPDAILGDMDSIVRTPPKEVQLIKFDTKKDMTDGELALNYLIEKDYNPIRVYGAEGGRLDHIISNLHMLKLAIDHRIDIIVKCNDYDVFISDGVFKGEFKQGDEVSLVPFSDEVHISYTKGLEYPLEKQILLKSSSRGISNVCLEDDIEISIQKGVCFIFRIFR